jgi:hypothetical protein
MAIADRIYEQVKTLPEDLAQEVLDFIQFLEDRRGNKEKADLIGAQQGAMDKLWSNREDEIWNDL